MVSMIWITSSSPTVTSKVVGSGLTPARLGTSGMEIEALPTRDGAVLTQLHYSPKVSCDCRTGFDCIHDFYATAHHGGDSSKRFIFLKKVSYTLKSVHA